VDKQSTNRKSGPGAAGDSSPSTDPAASALSGADTTFGLVQSADAGGSSCDARVGTRFGGVTLVRLLGEGGMGAVYEARQDAPRRTVAVKVMRGGLASPGLTRRFEYEVELLARLRHPNIAQIHSCGVHAEAGSAIPYFVMELVEEARPITAHASQRELGVRERVALMRTVCAAVAHGHQKGVIHRDLKPGNILVDGDGVVKVIDFGVARAIDADEATSMTRAGDFVGTLRYTSPEQVGGAAGEADASTDVYAIGLVLHEVLTGVLPYELDDCSVVEAARVLGDSSPVSTATVERVAWDAGLSRLDAKTLATIVGACLEKKQGDRYATAVEVEAELARWERGEPIVARPPTAMETVLRLARRHRTAAAATAAVFASLVAGVSGVSFFYVRAERQRELAVVARQAAEEREAEAERQAAAARSQLYISNVLLAAASRDRDNVSEARRLLRDARRLVADAGTDHPLELDCLEASLDESVATITGHAGTVTAVGWSRDGTRMATATSEGAVRLGTWIDGAVTMDPSPMAPHDGPVWAARFSPDGAWLATASADGGVRISDAATGATLATLTGHDGAVYAAAFSPDGKSLVTGGRDRVIRVWDTAGWRPQKVVPGHDGTIFGLAYSPDGAIVASSSLDGTVRLWDVASESPLRVFSGHEQRVFSVAFAPDGRELASAGEDGTVRVWDVASGSTRLVIRHPFRVNGVAYLDDGARIASVSGDGVLRVWQAGDGTESDRLRGHAAAVWSVAVGPSAGWLLSGGADGTARVWDATRTVAPRMETSDKVLSVACSDDGQLIAAAQANSVVTLWDTATLVPRGVLRKAVGRVNDVCFSPSGETIAGCCDDGTVQLWDRSTRERTHWIKPHARRVYAVAFSPDGHRIATASEDRTARVWDVGAEEARGEPFKHPRRVFRAVFSPDGTMLATACEDRVARLWRVDDGTEVRRFEGHEGPVNWVAFSRDGAMLTTASSDGAVRAWDAADGGLISVMTGPSRQVWKAAFSPDGHRLAAVSADGTAQLWDVATGRATPMLRGHTDQVWGVAFSADGRSLVTGSWDGTARVWGVTAAEIALRRHESGAVVRPTRARRQASSEAPMRSP